jgi:hypothetical protein
VKSHTNSVNREQYEEECDGDSTSGGIQHSQGKSPLDISGSSLTEEIFNGAIQNMDQERNNSPLRFQLSELSFNTKDLLATRKIS